MSIGTGGWSLVGHAASVVVTFPPGDEVGRRLLAVDDARVVWGRVDLAPPLAGRNIARGETQPSYWRLSAKPPVTGVLVKVVGHKVDYRWSLDCSEGGGQTDCAGAPGELVGLDAATRGGAE